MSTSHGLAQMPTDPSGLPAATRPEVLEVPPGGSVNLAVRHVAKTIGDGTFAMLGYNGSIPGPTLRVRQGSRISVTVHNETEAETTVHWHGLRLENRYDGVPRTTQEPIAPGGSYTHELSFPDPGTFWYHPHIREDYAQELGLYGNVIVDPEDPGYWPAADEDVVLTLDDVLIEDGRISPFDEHGPNFAAMGRFGNVLLVGGETHQRIEVRRGQVVRLHLTNTANTRVFKVVLPGARMKLVGGDASRYEREEWVDGVVVAPSERAVVDVLLDTAGTFPLQHVTPQRAYPLGEVIVAELSAESSGADAYTVLRTNPEMVAERERIARYLGAPPDKTLALVAEMDFVAPEGSGVLLYTCPMHPDVVSEEPGKCPKCGMKLMPGPTAPEAVHGHAHPDESDLLEGGIEWEDLMVEVNRATTAATMRWKVVDRDTGRENAGIDWVFTAGEQVKIRLVNEMESDHPMHHPFHVHGERFLVLARDGEVERNLVWKDTVLVPTGQTVDILLDASNPGRWMAHCHIAEHMEVGMMFEFVVREQSATPGTATSRP